jgi:hypothetical protein
MMPSLLRKLLPGKAALWLLPTCALLLLAADPSWKNKAIRDWTEQDARLVLNDSPWAANVRAAVMPLQSESARMQGGQMGQPHGVGYAGVDPTTDKQKVAKVLSGDLSGPAAIGPVPVRVRWESALPVRAAELKAHEVEPPTLEGEGYQIAVYGIPGSYLKGDPRTLGEPLRKSAALQRDGKPDVKPSRVEVFQTPAGRVVAYLFPFSGELSQRDTLVQFNALIGRISVVHSFDLREMRFDGKLEL